MSSTFYGVALLGWAVGVGAVVVSLMNSGLENTLCSPPNGTSQACTQLQSNVNLALFIGVLGIVAGIVFTVMSLRAAKQVPA